jgi:hypothetical protein
MRGIALTGCHTASAESSSDAMLAAALADDPVAGC